MAEPRLSAADIHWERDEAHVARDALADLYATVCSQKTETAAELVSARQEIEQLRKRLGEAEWVAGRDIADPPDVDLIDRIAKLRTGREQATARALELAKELAEARELIAVHEQLEAVRDWIVARDGGRSCERCEQEVRRGEAYELEPGTGGLIQHIHCPDLPLPDSQIPPTEGQQ